MFDFLKPAKHTALTRSDWAAIDHAATSFAAALKERLEGLDAEIEKLQKEVGALRAEVRREPRLSLRQKINQKEK